MRTAAAALVLLFSLAPAPRAGSQPESRQLLRARGVLVEYDAEAGSLAVEERGRVRSYFLLAGGEAGETEVVIEAAPAGVADLRPGAPIVVSWRPDDADPTRRVAHKLEVPAIPKSYRDDLR